MHVDPPLAYITLVEKYLGTVTIYGCHDPSALGIRYPLTKELTRVARSLSIAAISCVFGGNSARASPQA